MKRTDGYHPTITRRSFYSFLANKTLKSTPMQCINSVKFAHRETVQIRFEKSIGCDLGYTE
jgi:hypothetical protein